MQLTPFVRWQIVRDEVNNIKFLYNGFCLERVYDNSLITVSTTF